MITQLDSTLKLDSIMNQNNTVLDDILDITHQSELDDMIDELEGKVYVLVTFNSHRKQTIHSTTERMTKKEAMTAWMRSTSQCDHVAHWKKPYEMILYRTGDI